MRNNDNHDDDDEESISNYLPSFYSSKTQKLARLLLFGSQRHSTVKIKDYDLQNEFLTNINRYSIFQFISILKLRSLQQVNVIDSGRTQVRRTCR